MFVCTCKRLRIMKGSEARGLGCGVWDKASRSIKEAQKPKESRVSFGQEKSFFAWVVGEDLTSSVNSNVEMLNGIKHMKLEPKYFFVFVSETGQTVVLESLVMYYILNKSVVTIEEFFWCCRLHRNSHISWFSSIKAPT